MPKKPTTKQVRQLVQQVEQKNPPLSRNLYVSASQLTNWAGQKVWSCLLVENQQILARFNNQQVIRPLEAKAYAILRIVYWLREQNIRQVTLWTDNYDIGRRFLKLSQRPLSAGYQLEREFYYSQRGKLAWPYYLWLARKLVAEQDLDLVVAYCPRQQNPASLISQSLKVCAKCQQLKKIAPRKRNCYACWKASQQVKYQRWQEWQKSFAN